MVDGADSPPRDIASLKKRNQFYRDSYLHPHKARMKIIEMLLDRGYKLQFCAFLYLGR